MQNFNDILKINENNKLNMLVVDNFYEDPISVREFALSQNIDILTNHPGKRTISFSSHELRTELQKLIEPYGEIDDMYIPMEQYYCIDNNTGSFFINTSIARIPWIHNDSHNYSAILYLNPYAPVKSGTSIFETNSEIIKKKMLFDKTKWKEVDTIGNKFNRILIFNCLQYHLPNNYFGINNDDGRLTQVIWFNIIPKRSTFDTINMNDTNHQIMKSLYPCKLHPNHNCDFIVIDNFYSDPIAVREFALSQKFYLTGNFPGKRTSPFLTNEIIKKIDRYLDPFGIDMSNIRNDESQCGSFQYITSDYRKVVQISLNNDWSGIIFLTPDAPVDTGLSFYEYKDKNSDINIMNTYSQDMTKWKEVDKIGNIFNRFILFNSKKWHTYKNNFGTDIDNGLLVQVFFM
jgi:hypothetical protein